jgi:hypothetical protein
VEVALSEEGKSGLYYVMIWVKAQGGKSVVASNRTVVVE